jgi:hypothetical protein
MLIYDPEERITPTQALQSPFMLAGAPPAQADASGADHAPSSAATSGHAAGSGGHSQAFSQPVSGETSHTAVALTEDSNADAAGDSEKIGNRRSLRWV